MDEDDYESIFAKYGINGIWDEKQHKKIVKQIGNLVKEDESLKPIHNMLNNMAVKDPNVRPLHHRRMSNNSIAFETKPSKDYLDLLFNIMQAEGEPGIINMEEALRRRPNAKGLNPCAEILLDSYGVCNLTTVNLVNFVDEDKDGTKYLDMNELQKAQRASARAGLRMTLVELELPHWDAIQQRDRLLGTSMTGVKDALAMVTDGDKVLIKYPMNDFISWTHEELLLEKLGDVARDEADRYAKEMRVSAPLLVTSVKPEGTISQVAGGVSSGLHFSHAPYYIRRIRINSNDPLAKAVQSIGWNIYAEVGTLGYNTEEELASPEALEAARTWVIDFPIKSGATKTKNDVMIEEQFDTYFEFQDKYTEHNSSITVHTRPDEWTKASDIVYDGWDNYVGVSFLAHDGGSYTLAPYEEISEEQYNYMIRDFNKFDRSILMEFETGEDSDLEGMDGCEGGICPVR